VRGPHAVAGAAAGAAVGFDAVGAVDAAGAAGAGTLGGCQHQEEAWRAGGRKGGDGAFAWGLTQLVALQEGYDKIHSWVAITFFSRNVYVYLDTFSLARLL